MPQAEYNIKDAEVNNLVMVPCARATENGLVEFLGLHSPHSRNASFAL